MALTRVRNRLSLAHLTAIDASPLELIDAASAGGFDSIGLRIVPPTPSDSIVPVIGDGELIKRIQRRLDETGLNILDIEAVWLTADTSTDALLPVLETTARLGAHYLLVVGNDPDEPRATASLAGLAEAARPFDIKVMLEFIPYCSTNSLQAAQRLVQGAAQPNIGVLVDVLHLFRSGGSPDDVRAVDPSLLDYCQICDAASHRPATDALRAEARGGRFYPGEGELALGAVLDALPAGLPLAVEAPCARDVSLSPLERGRRCGTATRAFLDRYQQ
jgi:sugar phosphate isomerase/epimerase